MSTPNKSVAYQFTGLIRKKREMKRTVRLDKFFVILDDLEQEEEKLDESRDELESSDMLRRDESEASR